MTSPPNPKPPTAPRVCSWCGKTEGDVKVVAGPGTNICEGCVRLACAVLGLQLVTEEAEADPGTSTNS